MKHPIRFFAFLLALFLTFGCTALLASCADKPEDDPTEDDSTKTDVLANLPKTKFNADFIYVSGDNFEYSREDSSGDNVDYAIYMRNKKVEDTYGVTLKAKNMTYTDIPPAVANSIKADDPNAMDVVSTCNMYVFNVALQGNAQNWQNVPYLDLTAEWWSPSCLNDLTMNDQTYLLAGDMNLTAIAYTYCMYYNVRLADEYQLGDLYDLAVNQKAWTFDKMLEVIKICGKKDLNQDNKYNANDQYAFGTAAYYPVMNYLWAFGGKIFTKNEEGGMDFTFYNDKTASIYKKITKLLYRNDDIYFNAAKISASELAPMFANDQFVLMNGLIESITQHFRDIDSEGWGLLPYPMWNAAQAKTVGYQTMVDGSASAMVLPNFRGAASSKNEKIGVVLEAMNALSHDGVRVEYFQKALKSKYVSDPKQAKMIDLLMASRVYDFGYVHLMFDSPGVWMYSCVVGSKSDNVAGYYAQMKNTLNKAITDVYAVFGEEFAGLD